MKKHWILGLTFTFLALAIPLTMKNGKDLRTPASIASLNCTESLQFILTESRLTQKRNIFSRIFNRPSKEHLYNGYLLSKTRFQRMADEGTFQNIKPANIRDGQEWLAYIEVMTKMEIAPEEFVRKNGHKVYRELNSLDMQRRVSGGRTLFGLMRADRRFTPVKLKNKLTEVYKILYKSPFQFRYLGPEAMDELIYRLGSESLTKKGLSNFLTDHNLLRVNGARVAIENFFDSAPGQVAKGLFWNMHFFFPPLTWRKLPFLTRPRDLPLPDSLIKKLLVEGFEGNETLVRNHLRSHRLGYAFGLLREKYRYFVGGFFLFYVAANARSFYEASQELDLSQFEEYTQLVELTPEEQAELLRQQNRDREIRNQFEENNLTSECFGFVSCVKEFMAGGQAVSELIISQCKELTDPAGECQMSNDDLRAILNY